jgi:hypothetical protein
LLAYARFITQKPDLALLDVLPAEGAVEKFQISFVVAPDHLLRTADELFLPSVFDLVPKRMGRTG